MESIIPESSLGGGDSPTPADGFHVISAVAAIRDLPSIADFVLKALDFAKEDPENLSLAGVDLGMLACVRACALLRELRLRERPFHSRLHSFLPSSGDRPLGFIHRLLL